MNPAKLNRKLHEIGNQLVELSKELSNIEPLLKLNMDKKAVAEIITNLSWAAENSTVVGLHQIEEALDDNMGTGLHD